MSSYEVGRKESYYSNRVFSYSSLLELHMTVEAKSPFSNAKVESVDAARFIKRRPYVPPLCR